jgi:hypothetical protein
MLTKMAEKLAKTDKMPVCPCKWMYGLREIHETTPSADQPVCGLAFWLGGRLDQPKIPLVAHEISERELGFFLERRKIA